MSIWHEPITVERIWRGPLRMSPFATVALTLWGRVLLLLFFCVLAILLFAMIVFEIAFLLNDPWPAIGCWSTLMVAILVVRLWSRSRHRHDPPDDPTEGTGIPIPRPTGPGIRVGVAAADPPESRRFG